MRELTHELFERYHFPALRPDRMLRHLTLAERQIVEIAKALARNPHILVLDEAISALGAPETDWLLKLARQIAAEDRLVIFISHRMGEVRTIADRITIFRNGQTVSLHDVDKVSDEQVVTEMIGRSLERLYPVRISTRTRRCALEVRNLSSGRHLRDATFSLHEGEVLGVGGFQGHGQRELFQALFSASASTGTVELWGRPITRSKPRHYLSGRDCIALVPEDRGGQGLLLSKTVGENLTLSVIHRFPGVGCLIKTASGISCVRWLISWQLRRIRLIRS